MFPQFKFPYYVFSIRHIFSALKLTGDSVIKSFIENQPPVESNHIHGFAKCLPPKIGGLAFLLGCAMLDSRDHSITTRTNLE